MMVQVIKSNFDATKHHLDELWVKFKRSELEIPYGGTLFYIMKRCEMEVRPYTITAYPGKSYTIKLINSKEKT